MKRETREHFRHIPEDFVTPEELFNNVPDNDCNRCITGIKIRFL